MVRRGPNLNSVFPAGGKPPPQADVLMAIFADNYIPGCTPDGDPLAVDAWEAVSVMIPLKGKRGLRQRLAVDMLQLTGKMPSQEAQTTVTGVIEGICIRSQFGAAPALRAARLRGDAFLDLGRRDGAVAVISPGSWQLTTRPPVLFRRSGLTSPLPVPSGPWTGSLDGARHLLNIMPGGQWTAFVACRIASLLYPAATHPVEIFTSDTSGSLKTSTVRLAKAWTDPGPFLPVPRDAKSWAATAGNTYAAAIDNVSAIPDWWSDLLCKGASGDAWADRALYTDGEAYSAQFSIVPMIDGIGVVALRADLADRAIRHHLKRPDAYLGDDEAAQTWEREHPAALAWLLDQAAAVARLHALGTVARPRTGRMAVYEWVLAALDALWDTGGAGADWFRASQRGVAEDTVSADVLAEAISDKIARPVAGSAGEILAALGYLTEDDKQMWTTQKAGRRMPRAADALAKLGWHLERRETGHARSKTWLVYPPDTWVRKNGETVCKDTGEPAEATPAPAPDPLAG